MTSKVYAFIGRNFATIDLLDDNTKGRVQITFSGGDMHNKKVYSPAKSKPISDPAIQALIENSSYFKSGTIIVYELRESKDVDTHVAELKEVPEVVDFVTACDYLKKNHGAKATQLKSPAGVRKLAKSINLSFPNWEE